MKMNVVLYVLTWSIHSRAGEKSASLAFPRDAVEERKR